LEIREIINTFFWLRIFPYMPIIMIHNFKKKIKIERARFRTWNLSIHLNRSRAPYHWATRPAITEWARLSKPLVIPSHFAVFGLVSLVARA
jgi:hypothetical protein